MGDSVLGDDWALALVCIVVFYGAGKHEHRFGGSDNSVLWSALSISISALVVRQGCMVRGQHWPTGQVDVERDEPAQPHERVGGVAPSAANPLAVLSLITARPRHDIRNHRCPAWQGRTRFARIPPPTIACPPGAYRAWSYNMQSRSAACIRLLAANTLVPGGIRLTLPGCAGLKSGLHPASGSTDR